MEKVTFLPLITHLKEESELYNQMYRNQEIKSGRIDTSRLSIWMVEVIEPVIREVHSVQKEALPQIFKALYAELLTILVKKPGIVYEQQYKKAWKLCAKIPGLFGVFPSRILKAINSAIEAIRTYQPEKVPKWLFMMENTVDYSQSIEEFLALGRINAWLCGMAHLRSKAKDEYPLLGNGLKQVLETSLSEVGGIENAMAKKWVNLPRAQFVGETGGFIGFGGNFVAPPLVSEIGGQLVATDKKNNAAIFTDFFGNVLLSDVPFTAEKILAACDNNGIEAFQSQHGFKLIPFFDVSSSVMIDHTLVLTRSSSHYLYIYGWTK